MAASYIKILKFTIFRVFYKLSPSNRHDPPICKKCQRLGHTKAYCLREPRCIKCGDNHVSDQCTLDKSLNLLRVNVLIVVDHIQQVIAAVQLLKNFRLYQHKATDTICQRNSSQTQFSKTLPG